MLWKLRERKWIDLSTRAVLIDFNVMNLNYYSMATASVVSDDDCCFVREECCFVREDCCFVRDKDYFVRDYCYLSGTRIILSGRTAILSGTTAIGPLLFQ